MRFKLALTTFLILGTTAAVAQDLSTEKGKLSYAVGWNLGTDIGRQVDEFDVEALVTAIRDSAAGRDPQVEAPEMRRLLTELQERVRQEHVFDERRDGGAALGLWLVGHARESLTSSARTAPTR